MDDKIINLSRELGLPVSKIRDFLYMLRIGEAIENNLFLQKLGVAKTALNQLKEELAPWLMPKSKYTQLRDDKVKEVENLFDNSYQTEDMLWQFIKSEKYTTILKALTKYQDKHPTPERKYDQFTATVDTVAKRAVLMDFFADIKDKKLAFMGDDDFTSVAVALANKAAKITVFEIDQRISTAIKAIAAKENLELEVIEYDARGQVPANYQQKFDVVFTDPPYTPDGIALFVSRCIELLDSKNQAARLYICYGNSDRAKERFLPIQKVFADCGLMVRWLFDKFNRYSGAESIGSASSLYIADVTPLSHSIIQGSFNENIYTS